MKVITILIVLCFGATITSSALYGAEVRGIAEWWNDNYFIKFNSPSGKTFYIDFFDGTIHREKDPKSSTFPELPPRPPPPPGLPVSQTEVPLNAEEKLPFISFVSIDFTIYDIYFDDDGVNNHNPRLEKSEFVYEAKYLLIRPRLDSFVGPNKKVYRVIHGDDNELNITEKSPDVLGHFQIKTFGPYEKWEHTYDFSENGEIVVDHTISPIPVQANRSISLPELEPNTFIQENGIQTFVKFNSPSGTEYHITTQLDIVPVCDDVTEKKAYITFTEPDGRTYDVHIDENDGASLVARSKEENYFETRRLYSFAAPNRILYRIDHKYEGEQEVPMLGSLFFCITTRVRQVELLRRYTDRISATYFLSSPSNSSDLHITLMTPSRHYNTYVKYIFADNGKKLFDRVDEVDWAPLNELPAVPVDEVTADYVMANQPFLTLYTPNGNNYHIFTSGTNASIIVEKRAKHSQNLYISWFQSSGRRTNIYFVPGADPYLEEETESTRREDDQFYFLSFTTPDRKGYSITGTLGDDGQWKTSIRLPSQVKEPIDLSPVDGLFVSIQNGDGWNYIYRFTWNGDKLVEASLAPPRHFVDNKVLQSLIGK